MPSKTKVTNQKKKEFTLLGVCYSPVTNPDESRHNVRFLCKEGDKEIWVSPSDQELIELFDRDPGLEQHDSSNRTEPIPEAVVTGFEYDPIKENPFRFDFSDATERPLRWPVLSANLYFETLSQLVKIHHDSVKTKKGVRRGK